MIEELLQQGDHTHQVGLHAAAGWHLSVCTRPLCDGARSPSITAGPPSPLCVQLFGKLAAEPRPEVHSVMRLQAVVGQEVEDMPALPPTT